MRDGRLGQLGLTAEELSVIGSRVSGVDITTCRLSVLKSRWNSILKFSGLAKFWRCEFIRSGTLELHPAQSWLVPHQGTEILRVGSFNAPPNFWKQTIHRQLDLTHKEYLSYESEHSPSLIHIVTLIHNI